MAKRQKNKTGASLQSLLGIKRFTEYGLLTTRAELIFFHVTPTNISVLSNSSVEAKINKLRMLLGVQSDLEIICLDSSECFDENKGYLLRRRLEENNTSVRKLITRDAVFLDEIQMEMSTARQFMFCLRCRNMKPQQVFRYANDAEKAIAEQGFETHRMSKDEIKRFLALYFESAMYGESLPDADGLQYYKKKKYTQEEIDRLTTKDYFDCVIPATLKINHDHYIFGDTYRCIWAIREYPPVTEEQAILASLADRNGVTLHIYNRPVGAVEEEKILQNASRKNKMKSVTNNVSESVEAEGNLQDLYELVANLKRDNEILLHTAVYIELKAKNMEELEQLQREVQMELTRSKIMVDRLTMRQKEGFLSVLPVGANQFLNQFERVLPSGSVANLYPFNYSGKTDPQGLYIGRDKYGTNILVDFDRRAEDKTTSNILILGSSGQGKSYLMKLILTNIRESGKRVICLDPEAEYQELCENGLGGCYIDFLSGEYKINPLEPKAWSDNTEIVESDSPEAFKKVTRLSQHIAFLKDFFRCYKDFNDQQIDTIELLLSKLYARFGITDTTDYSTLKSTDYPIMEDFYKLCEEEYMTFDKQRKYLYTEETLQEVCLGINSMCVGAESKYFNGYTNVTDSDFVCFGVKGMLETNTRLRNAMLFNIL